MVMAGNGFEVRRLSGSIGAEILGIDLASEPGDNVIGEIRQVWLEHNVIFFRDQDLPPAKFLAFAKRFGEVVEYPFIKGIEGFPEIIPVIKLEHETKNFGGIWHTDTAYLESPPMGTMLIAREVPPYGGDTLFANTYLAYDTLSEGMKRMLDGLIAVNHSAKADVTRTREDRLRGSSKAEAKKEYISEHPVVRTHPVTGKKALYVNRGFTSHIVGIPRDESDAILSYLYQHAENPLFQCRFRWTENAIAFWDNRCAQHRAMWDYWPHSRSGTRVTVKGERPV